MPSQPTAEVGLLLQPVEIHEQKSIDVCITLDLTQLPVKDKTDQEVKDPHQLTLEPVRTEPNQPKGTFPVTTNYKRSFKDKWYEKFPWLEYDPCVNAAFCHPCRQISLQNIKLLEAGN